MTTYPSHAPSHVRTPSPSSEHFCPPSYSPTFPSYPTGLSPSMTSSSPPLHCSVASPSSTFQDDFAFLDGRFTSPTTTSPPQSYSYHSSHSLPRPHASASPPQSATAFSSLAMSVPDPSVHLPPSYPCPAPPSHHSILPAPTLAPVPHYPHPPFVEPLDQQYALKAIASMTRKRKREGVYPLPPEGPPMRLRLPPHLRREQAPDGYESSPRSDRFPSPLGYERRGSFPSSVGSGVSSAPTSPLSLLAEHAASPYTVSPGSPIMYRKSSCLLCHKAKTSCDGRRPCDRCIRLDRQEQCVERVKSASKRKPVLGKKRKEDSGDDQAEKDDDSAEKEGDDDTSSPPHPSDSASTITPSEPTAVVPTAGDAGPSTQRLLPSERSAVDTSNLISLNDRELSRVMVRILQSDQVSIRSLLRTASERKILPPMTLQVLISYLANGLHPEDYQQFMASINSHDKALLTGEGEGEGDHVPPVIDRLQVRLPDGTLMPRVLFTFRKSSFVAQPDSDIAVNTAQILVWRARPTKQAAQPVKEQGGEGVGLKKEEGRPGSPSLSTKPRFPHVQVKGGDGEFPKDEHAHPLAAVETDEPFVPAPVPGAMFGSLSEVDLIIQFGYSQREIRDLVMREQTKGLWRLYTPKSLMKVARWLTEAITGVRSDFSALVSVVNKGKGVTEVLLTARFILDQQDFFQSICYTYTPLPKE